MLLQWRLIKTMTIPFKLVLHLQHLLVPSVLDTSKVKADAPDTSNRYTLITDLHPVHWQLHHLLPSRPLTTQVLFPIMIMHLILLQIHHLLPPRHSHTLMTQV
jgi:hypothetical protein